MGVLGFLSKGPKTVLVADDDERMTRLVKTILEQDGRYRVLRTSDGSRALSMARRERPDLVLLDVRMPSKTGYDVCEALKSDHATSRIKVLIVSGTNEDEVRHWAKEVRANGYISKPFKPADLLKRVQQEI